MASEVEQLIEAVKQLGPAIESLNQKSFSSEYIWPMSVSFFSAFFGATGGYAIFRLQERSRTTKLNFEAANKWMHEANNCFSTLAAIKFTYIDELTPDPIQRCGVPCLRISIPPLDIQISNLDFITPRERRPIRTGEKIGFNNLGTIHAMFKNYNFLLSGWEKRNAIARPLQEKIIANHPGGGGKAAVSLNNMLKILGAEGVADLIETTEAVLSKTDEVLQELHDFLTEFPGLVTTAHINGSFWRELRRTLGIKWPVNRYLWDDAYLSRALKKVPVDQEQFIRDTSHARHT